MPALPLRTLVHGAWAAILVVACSGPGDDTAASETATTDASAGSSTAGSTGGTATSTATTDASASASESSSASTSATSTATSTTAGTTTDSTTTSTTSSTTTTSTTTNPSTTGDPPGPGATIPVGGGDYFLLGANYPWKSYGGDFGGNNWGTYGVHTKAGEIGGDLGTLAQNNLRVVRWFVLTDGRAGVTFDDQGVPTGLGEHVLGDLDAAVDLAEAAGVYLVPVILDFHWMFYAKFDNGVQMGGRADVITDPQKRGAFVDKVVVPLVDHNQSPAILAWEIINEPEWSIADLPQASPDGQAEAVPLADFYAFSAAISAAIHQHSAAYVTLGSACLKWHRVWTPAFAQEKGWPSLELDFYQAHYYPWMDNQMVNGDPELGTTAYSPTVQDVAALGLDRPMVVGELIISDSAAERLDTLMQLGYAGVWPWSLTSDYSLDLGGLKAWGDAHADLTALPAP